MTLFDHYSIIASNPPNLQSSKHPIIQIGDGGMRVAIEPDLAGERKAQWNLMSQRCYLLLSLESGVTMWLSDVISCHQLLPITRYCLQLHAISCYAWLLLFAAIRCYMLLFAGVCCYLLLFVAGCCNLLLFVAGCCCLLFFYCCLLLLAEDSC